MANYFIGSVGTAEAFKVKDGKMEMAFVSKTLTDSALNISTTKEDLRGGSGAPIVTSFYHSPTVEINLTDIMWKRAYVESQLGASFDSSDRVVTNYITEEITATAGEIALSKQAVDLPISCDIDSNIAWVTKKGTSNWKAYEFTAGESTSTISSADFEAGADYCVRYLAEDIATKEAIIYSNIIPQELFLIITATIYAGDKCAASNGTYAGTITFEIPRFRLNGAQDFSFNMSSNTTLSLAGTAYAEDEGCDLVKGGKLVSIKELIFADQGVAPDRIYIDDSTRTVAEMNAGGTLNVYGIFGSVVKLLSNTNNITFTKTSSAGTISSAGVIGGTWLANDTIKVAFKTAVGEDPSATVIDVLTVIA